MAMNFLRLGEISHAPTCTYFSPKPSRAMTGVSMPLQSVKMWILRCAIAHPLAVPPLLFFLGVDLLPSDSEGPRF